MLGLGGRVGHGARLGRTAPRALPAAARACRDARGGAVARLVDRGLDGDRHGRRFRAVVEGDVHAVLQQVHGNVGHAGHGPRRLLHARGARRARHAGDIERLLHFLLLRSRPPLRANGCFT